MSRDAINKKLKPYGYVLRTPREAWTLIATILGGVGLLILILLVLL